MGVVLKHTFKNIWSKPFRTIMLVICICFASFTAALAFDMSNSIVNILRSAFGSMYGKANAIVVCNQGIDEEKFAAIGDYEKEYALLACRQTEVCMEGELGAPNTYNKREMNIYCFSDMQAFNEMKLAARTIDLADEEIVICKKYAEEFHLNVGDQVTLNGDPLNEEQTEFVTGTFTVKDIVPYHGVLSAGYDVLVSEEGMKSLSSENAVNYVGAYCKLANEKEVKDFCREVSANLPMSQAENLVDGTLITSQISQVTAVFYFIFIISLLLVIFVTISLSERIMVERMSTIGTLRSLGVSPRTTTIIVLMENALYGLLGGILGVLAYVKVRDPLFNSVFSINSGSELELTMDLGKVSMLTMVLVVVGTIAVECICPIKELIRAVKTPIRDIIFDTKDAEFKYGKKSLIAAIVLASIGIPCLVVASAFAKENVLLLTLGMMLPIGALFLGYPHLLRGICNLLAKFFEKRSMPVAQLACVQASTKKANVGNSRLCVMAVTLCLMLFSIVAPLNAVFDHQSSDADIVISQLKADSEAYACIAEMPHVTGMELLYVNSPSVVIGTARIDEFLSPERAQSAEEFALDNITLAGMNGAPKMCKWFLDVPETIGENEIVITETLGRKYNVKVGDEMEIFFNPYGENPVRKTLRVAGVACSTYFDVSDTTFIMNQDIYKDLYGDEPYELFVKSDDPQASLEKISQYTANIAESAELRGDYEVRKKNENAGMSTLFYLIMAMGIGLTIIAVISNQVVGFESRKRECAVLISTAMSKGKVKRMFFLESLLSAVLAIGLAVGISFGMKAAMMNFVKLLSFSFPNVTDISGTVLIACGLLLAFTLTILDPLRHLRKMKTAEQLKYE